MKQKVRFDYDMHAATIVFIVDREKFTEEMAKETLEFFVWDEPYDKEGDLVLEFLKKAALKAFPIACYHNWNAYGISEWFAAAEGWPAFIKENGLEIVSITNFEFLEDDLRHEILEA